MNLAKKIETKNKQEAGLTGDREAGLVGDYLTYLYTNIVISRYCYVSLYTNKFSL